MTTQPTKAGIQVINDGTQPTQAQITAHRDLQARINAHLHPADSEYVAPEKLFEVGETIDGTQVCPACKKVGGHYENCSLQPRQMPADIRHLSPPLPFKPLGGAVLSDDRVFRYMLWREVRESGKTVLFLGLNPSTADEKLDDPTIRREVQFTKDWGFRKLLKGNLFAYRETDPDDLRFAENRVGPENDRYLIELRKEADLCVCAWGNDGDLDKRADQVIALLLPYGPLYCLKVNKTRAPSHPLYLKASLKPILYIGVEPK